jgi:hypothetical protein
MTFPRFGGHRIKRLGALPVRDISPGLPGSASGCCPLAIIGPLAAPSTQSISSSEGVDGSPPYAARRLKLLIFDPNF